MFSFADDDVVYIESVIPLIRVIGILYILAIAILMAEYIYYKRKLDD